MAISLQWRHNEYDGVWNHQPHHCLLKRLFRRRWKKTSKLRVTGLCAGTAPMIGEFPAQMASNAENVSIWRRHHTVRFARCFFLQSDRNGTCEVQKRIFDFKFGCIFRQNLFHIHQQMAISLQWRHNEHNGVSNHQPHDCLLNRLFRHRSRKTSKLRFTGFCEGISPVTGEFPTQRVSNADNVSIWWRHCVLLPVSRLVSFTHWGLKIIDVPQKTLSNALWLIKMHAFLLKYCWSLLLSVSLAIGIPWFR